MMSDISERLRERHSEHPDGSIQYDEDAFEAANEIVRLRAQLEKAKAVVSPLAALAEGYRHKDPHESVGSAVIKSKDSPGFRRVTLTAAHVIAAEDWLKEQG